jgi:hypothetical protein
MGVSIQAAAQVVQSRMFLEIFTLYAICRFAVFDFTG